MVPASLAAMGTLAGMPGKAGSEYVLRASQTLDETMEHITEWSGCSSGPDTPGAEMTPKG